MIVPDGNKHPGVIDAVTTNHPCVGRRSSSMLLQCLILSPCHQQQGYKLIPTYRQQFVDALRYCHSRHVCHRDLKLENTLLDGSVPPRIKLSDFGSSRTFDPAQNLHTKVGTYAYMSPQILAGTSVGYDGQVGDDGDIGV